MSVTLDYISKADILIAGTIIYIVAHIICILHKIKTQIDKISNKILKNGGLIDEENTTINKI